MVRQSHPQSAHIEILSGIIRVGPKSKNYGDPYELAVAFSSVDGKSATIKALVSDGKLKRHHLRAAMKALKSLGLTVRWERCR